MIWLAHLLLPVVALWLLWPTAYQVLWWITFALLVLNIWTAGRVRTAAGRHAKELGFREIPLPLIPPDPVQRFWVKLNLCVAVTLSIVSIVGITLACSPVLLYWGIGLTSGGVVACVISKVLTIRFIGKSCPDLLDEDIESGPLPDGHYRWEYTAGMGIVSTWISAIGLLGVAGFATGVIVLIITLVRQAFS
jgi:hypothetical protein